MGHKAACVAKQHMQLRKSAVDFSQLLTVEVEGCLNFSDFFFVFLGLRIFTRIYCIWSETREQNLNDLLSYNGPQILIKNRFTYPNDLPMTSNSLFFWLFLIYSLLFDLSSTGLIKKRGTQCFSSRKREPCTNDLHQPQFLIKHRCTYPNDLKQPLFCCF